MANKLEVAELDNVSEIQGRNKSCRNYRLREIGEKQLWKEIAKFMDGKSMVMLALCCKWFYQLLMDDSIWKQACLRDLQDQACVRDLQVPDPRNEGMKWIKLFGEKQLWKEIAKFMDGKSVVMLALCCKWFYQLLMDDIIWKQACLRDLPDQACVRDLQVPDPRNEGMKWIKLFASASDSSHCFTHAQKEKHIDWMRMGSFLFESSVAFLTDSLMRPLNIQKDETVEKTLELNGFCLLNNVKNGIWLADRHLFRCPACDSPTCNGTMQVLDARHIELFLYPEYQNGSWNYELLGSTEIQKHTSVSSVGIFDFKYLSAEHTEEVFDLKSWTGKANDEETKQMVALHAVALHNNLMKNEGLNVKFHVMRAGKDGEVVSIRISQRLL